MPDETIVCMVCGYNFTFEESERQWLLKQVEDGILPFFSKPKRCKECRRKRQQFGTSQRSPAAVKPVGTDQCGCKVAPDAPFPACPHDIRGAKGAEGEPGLSKQEAPKVLPAPSAATVAAPRPAPPAPKAQVATSPQPSSPPIAPFELRPVLPPREEEMRVILCTGDYERLLCREEIVVKEGNKTVRILLADIGFPAMKAALERAMLKWLKS